MKIILYDKTKDYISKYLNVDIEEIYLDEDSANIRESFLRFIEELIMDRTWTTVKTPYEYDKTTKQLYIGKRDDMFDSIEGDTNE